MEESQFKKLIDNLQPQSLSTKKLCERLGYNSADLKFMSLDEFTGLTPEMQKVRYQHYQQRTLKIINDIMTFKNKGKHHQQFLVNNRMGSTQLLPDTFRNLIFQSNNNDDQSESSINNNDQDEEQQKTNREKILKKLAYNELKERKKNIENIQQYSQKVSRLSPEKRKEKGKIQGRSGTEQSKHLKSKSSDKDEFVKRMEYLKSDEQLNSKVNSLKSSTLKHKSSKILNNDKMKQIKLEQSMYEEQFSQQTLQEMLVKEKEVQKRKEQQRIETISQLSEKNRQYIQKLQQRELKEIEEENCQINKQCQKYDKIIKKQDEFKQQENKLKKDRLHQTQQIRHKWLQRIDQLHQKQADRTKRILEDLQEKTKKVENQRKDYLNFKSQSLCQLQKIKEEDIIFNKTHNDMIKLQNDLKIIEKSKLTIDRQQRQVNKSEAQRLNAIKLQHQEKQKEEELWDKFLEARQLFDNSPEYEKYKKDLKAVMLKKKKNLEPKFIYLTNLIKQLLPEKEAEQILMPQGLKEEVQEEIFKLEKQQ